MKLNKIVDEIGEIEAAGLIFAYAVVFLGMLISFTNLTHYEANYAVEDGFLEWGTFFSLMAISFVCARRAYWLKNDLLARLANAFMSFVFFFGAGEEVSWAQRAFNVESPAFFKMHNSQGETNIHNLVYNGIKLNKLIFGLGLGIAVAVYLIIIPLAMKRAPSLRMTFNRLFVPFPKIYQVLAILGVFLITKCSPSPKRGEMLEFGLCFLIYLVFLFPANFHPNAIRR